MKGLLFIVLGLQIHAAAADAALGRSTKIWQRNTNFENTKNWIGYEYEGNCSNIFSFPMDMEPTVISLPSNTTLHMKEIILPRNGHLVFQQGPTTLSNSPSDTCQGVELKFGRTARGDWFDPNNWIGSDSLLNSKAIPHVERVPCQYDWVQFPPRSSFHLLISSDVLVSKFFLGDEELNYTKVAFLMSTQLGKVQFKKGPETQFELSNAQWEDTDSFICQNYNESIRQKICGLVKFAPAEDCPNPITPHGFCFPICGYHLKIQHNGNLPLSRVKTAVDSRIKSLGLAGMVGVHVGRYAQKFAHIVFIPWMNRTADVRKLIDEMRTLLASDSFVVKTTFTKSWEDGSGDVDTLTSSGMNGGVVALIVILVLIIICGTAIFIFFWGKRGYPRPPLSLNSIATRIRSIPGVSRSPRPSFTFARFSNERISTINIGQTSSGEIQRTEKVDADAEPMDAEIPETSASGFGFGNVTYDIIAVGVEPAGSADESVALTDIPSTSSTANKDSNEEENIYDVVEVPTSNIIDFSDDQDPKPEE